MPEKINLSKYDFVDFGCSVGGSMLFAQKAFDGGDAIGIDIDPAKVKKTQEAGYDAVLADATDPSQFVGRARFSMLSHFLEHLPDYQTVTKALRTAICISNDFVFIRQPWFDSDGELLQHGLKLYWSDWHGHPMTLTSLQMYRALRTYLESGRIARVTMFGHRPVLSSDDECVLPLSAPIDSSKYDAELHGPKPAVPIEFTAYTELVAVLAIRDPDITETLLGRFKTAVPIYDERATVSAPAEDSLAADVPA